MLTKADNIRKKQGAHTFSSLVNHIHWNKLRPARAGIIPFTFSKDKTLLFGFGLDKIYRELTDFGGGVSYKKDKTALNGAIREFQEESLGVFGNVTQDQLKDSLVLYTKNTLIIFVYFDADPEAINNAFYDRIIHEKNPEVSDIVWLTEKELKVALQPKSRLIYVRVSHILKNAGNYYNILNH
jgi:hypothetical protein